MIARKRAPIIEPSLAQLITRAAADPGFRELIQALPPTILRAALAVDVAEPPADQSADPTTRARPAPELPPGVKIDPQLAADAGEWIDTYVSQAMAVSPMTPRLFHESAALTLGAIGIARRLYTAMPYGRVYTNLYTVWIAQTTLYRKSTALDFARRKAWSVFAHLLSPEEWTPEALLSDFAGSAPSNYDQMTLSARAAWEAERAFAAQRGIIIDEVSGLLASAGKDYNAGMIEALLRFFDCTPRYERSTRGQGRLVIENSYVSLLGASTPRALAHHLTEERLWAMGFWPRFAILTPDTERPEWAEPIDRREPPELTGGLARLCERLPKTTWPAPIVARSVILGPGVYSAWSAYNKALSFDLLTEDLDGRLFGSYGRLPTHLLKIAMILAAFDWHEDQAVPTVQLRHLARAMVIAEQWRVSAHRALAAATQSGDDETAGRVLRHIAKAGADGASLRELCKAMRDRKPTDVEIALDELAKSGDIEAIEAAEIRGPGRPTVRYRVARK